MFRRPRRPDRKLTPQLRLPLFRNLNYRDSSCSFLGGGGGLAPHITSLSGERFSHYLACVVSPLPSSSQVIAKSSASPPPLSMIGPPPANDGTVDNGIVDDSVDVDVDIKVDMDKHLKERPSSSGPRGTSRPTATFCGFWRIEHSTSVGLVAWLWVG